MDRYLGNISEGTIHRGMVGREGATVHGRCMGQIGIQGFNTLGSHTHIKQPQCCHGFQNDPESSRARGDSDSEGRL